MVRRVPIGPELDLHSSQPSDIPSIVDEYVRAAAEAGLPRAVTAREADELLRDAATFVSLAETALGVPAQSSLPLPAAI